MRVFSNIIIWFEKCCNALFLLHSSHKAWYITWSHYSVPFYLSPLKTSSDRQHFYIFRSINNIHRLLYSYIPLLLWFFLPWFPPDHQYWWSRFADGLADVFHLFSQLFILCWGNSAKGNHSGDYNGQIPAGLTWAHKLLFHSSDTSRSWTSMSAIPQLWEDACGHTVWGGRWSSRFWDLEQWAAPP